MNKNVFFKNYFEDISNLTNNVNLEMLKSCAELILNSNIKGGKVIIAGNGGSAAISSHVSIDLNKAVGIPCINFNEPSMITCLANDYGYENWISEAIKIHRKKNDTVILLSSSGKSKNILNAMNESNRITNSTISLSGFEKNNKLCSLAHINLHIESKKYNYVEIIHNTWLLSILDFIIEMKNN